MLSDIILPFAVSGEPNFELLPPFNLGEPIMIQAPDGRQAIVAINKDAFYPAVFDANNQTTFLNGTDIQYTLDGTEKAINSGIILPPTPATGEGLGENTTAPSTAADELSPGAAELSQTNTTSNTTGQATEVEQEPPIGPPFPLVGSFTVTFEQPGTYPYFCAIHPWMNGQVIVREGGGGGQNQTVTEGGNQTGTQGEDRAEALTALFE